MSRPPHKPRSAVEALEPGADQRGKRRRGWRRHRDWGGLVARTLCALFALIGLVPLVVGGLARFDRFQLWAAERTAALLEQQLRVDASYELELSPWPLVITLSDVVVEANDGGSPFLAARTIVARPRIFSLLAGKPDLGEVEIEDVQVRAVIADGKLLNLSYQLPESSDDGEPLSDLPLNAIALTNGLIDVTVDDARVRSEQIDVDVTLGRMTGDKKPLLPIGLLEVSLHAGVTHVDQRHVDPAAPDLDMLDEDIICAVDVRGRVSDSVLVRRLELNGAVDFDPSPNTRPPCELPDGDWRQLSLKLEGGEVRFSPAGDLDTIDGRIAARVPAAIAHRFVDLPPVTGWVAVDLEDAHYDPSLGLPNVRGTLEGGGLGIESKSIADYLNGELSIDRNTVSVDDLRVGWGGGDGHFEHDEVRPLEQGMPLTARNILLTDVKLEDLLNDLNVHPHAHVGWTLNRASFDHFAGTLMPLEMSGPLAVESSGFGVYDKPTIDPTRQPFMAIERGTIGGTFRVTPEAIVLQNMTVRTGSSLVRTTVSLGYGEHLGLAVHDGTVVDLRDVSPLASIPMEGKANVTVVGGGNFGDPHLEATLDVDGFVFGGFPIGNILTSKVEFVPLALRFTEAKVHHGSTDVDVPLLNVDFENGDADVVLDGSIDSRKSGMQLHDFFEMVNLLPQQRRPEGTTPKVDPTWEDIDGQAFGVADIHYVLGGRRDSCDSGNLTVSANMSLTNVDLWDIQYDSGDIDVDWHWSDIEAGDQGLDIDVHSGVLRKGSGTVIANASIRRGAKIRAQVVATSVPLGEFQVFRDAFGLDAKEADDAALRRVRPEANVSVVANIGGTLGALEGVADINVTPMRIGPDLLPASKLSMTIVPEGEPPRTLRVTKCGNKVTPPFDPMKWGADEYSGYFKLAGELFGGQVKFDDLQITQQRAKMASGTLSLDRLDLGAMANLLPDVAFSDKAPRGTLSATVHVDELPIDDPGLAEVRLFVQEADIKRGDTTLHVGKVAQPLLLSGDALRIPTMPVEVKFGSGFGGKLVGGGSITQLSTAPILSLSSELDPIDLSKIGVDIPQLERAAGIVRAKLRLDGPIDAPQLGGELLLNGGMLRIKGVPLPIDDLDLDIRISDGEMNIRRATARVGNTGRLALNGRLPMRGVDIVSADATLVASDVKLPVADGVKLTADARLRITYAATSGAIRPLPNVSGRVTLKNFNYTRPMVFRLDLDQLTGGGRTTVDTYKPENDNVQFDVSVVSPQPVRIANNLLDMRLDIASQGIRVAGTDQRFGALGQLRISPGSKIYLQGHDFTVRDGTVNFDDPRRIAPKLDLSATTEYRRYAANVDTEATTTTSADAAGSGAGGGRWRISVNVHGDIDAPEVRFTSDPPLSQEDIVLLLSVGMTRAELDRNLSGALAQTVGLEALNAVTGLDQALRSTVPIIDEFRVGSQYSARTGRPEPSVTLGKRISEDVRATVTTGLSEDREVRSNIEWRLKGGVSVQGSYDNVNEVSSSALGNVGAGLRWRLEFE